jgi:CubicO group peptidase (beta-lactamase class C family)
MALAPLRPLLVALGAAALLPAGTRAKAQPPSATSSPPAPRGASVARPVDVPVAAAARPDAVDTIFAGWDVPGSPGCAVAAAADGRRVVSRAYGMADLDHGVANTPATVFETGSVAKQFAAAALLLLVEDGKLSLRDDVRTYVPELPDYGAVVTVGHLLAHTSGLREGHAVASLGGWAPVSEADLLDVMARQRALNHRPGAQFTYVGAGYFLASVIVRRVSGASLAAFSRDRLFRPLGMTATRWREDFRAVVKDRATAYRRTGAGYAQSMPAEDVYGHGGLLTTVGDLLLWHEALASGRVGRSVAAELHREGHLDDGRPTGYGRGVYVGAYRGHPEASHDGGHGAYRAWLGRYPDARLSVALLCNTNVPNVTALAHRVADVLLPPSPAGGGAPTPADTGTAGDTSALTPQAASRLPGVFLSDELGLPLRLGAEGGRLTVDGAAARRASTTRFRAGGLEVTFETPDLVRLRKRGGERQTLRRVAGPIPSGAELQALAGRYASDEAAGATYVAAVEDGRLVLRLDGRPAYVHALTPLGRDVFGGPGLVVRFHRGAGGTVDALAFSLPRVRELRFARVPAR